MAIRHDEARQAGLPTSTCPGQDGARERRGEPQRLSNLAAIVSHVRALRTDSGPSLLAIYLGRDSEHLATEELGQADAGTSEIVPMRIVGHASRIGAIGFVLVHHDPDRGSGPSAQELKVTRELRRLGEDLDTYLLHHLIIGRDGLKEVVA